MVGVVPAARTFPKWRVDSHVFSSTTRFLFDFNGLLQVIILIRQVYYMPLTSGKGTNVWQPSLTSSVPTLLAWELGMFWGMLSTRLYALLGVRRRSPVLRIGIHA
jgi:hypothetical protein